ncbi:CLUMA_CG013802, isoform A [Clunio marinus]|uniref:CLUMA_CG013802, isoform A n=1 Tax=Clunio marinus TaxID=568069 RepID=A0A1J1IJW5_9DIPT|nr:CLUMA_CG013802, isoform A [Clunio marinus]
MRVSKQKVTKFSDVSNHRCYIINFIIIIIITLLIANYLKLTSKCDALTEKLKNIRTVHMKLKSFGLTQSVSSLSSEHIFSNELKYLLLTVITAYFYHDETPQGFFEDHGLG